MNNIDVDVSELVEIDISKAFSAAFSAISEIPIFNEFDYWKVWNNTIRITDLSLYVVYTESWNLFLNKNYNLVYGKFLKKIIKKSNINILYYKDPSFIKQVNYKQYLEELYDSKICDLDCEDVYLKKTIANTNLGLLEKGVNRAQASKMFDTLEEAHYYQAKYGGLLLLFQRIEKKR